MIVVDLNGKERKVKSIKKIDHKTLDAITQETVSEIFVEVEIVGNNNTWVEWWPFDDFKQMNPNKRPRWK